MCFPKYDLRGVWVCECGVVCACKGRSGWVSESDDVTCRVYVYLWSWLLMLGK